MGVIYGLFDPRMSIELVNCRYVGETTKIPEARLTAHLSNAYNGSRNHVYKWIRLLFQDEVNPIMIVFQEVAETDIDGAEKAWVAAARYVGANLANETDGGRDGYNGNLSKWVTENPEHQKQIVQKFRDDPDTLAYRNARIKEGHAKRDKTPTMCECGDGPFLGQFGVDSHARMKHTDRAVGEVFCECGSGPFMGLQGLAVHKFTCGEKTVTFCADCGGGPFTGQKGLSSHIMHKHGAMDKEPSYCECGAGPFVGQHGVSNHKAQSQKCTANMPS